MDKDTRFKQAVIKLKEYVDRGIFGSVMINMQDGNIVNMKYEYQDKLPLDHKEKQD